MTDESTEAFSSMTSLSFWAAIFTCPASMEERSWRSWRMALATRVLARSTFWLVACVSPVSDLMIDSSWAGCFTTLPSSS
ncbi:hypothetical protein D3C72_2161650 [compost metagenome]